MGIPFKVVFRQRTHSYAEPYDIPIEHFVSNQKDLYKMLEENIEKAMENKWLELEFICENKNARLYMDGLDTIPEEYTQVDDTGHVCLPASNKLLLFQDDPTKLERGVSYYPLIPGHYRIKVVIEEEVYYSWLKITPKQMEEEQWIAMREEIENTLHGLAQDLVRKNASLGDEGSAPIPIEFLRKLFILRKEFSKWLLAIKEIEAEPRMRIGKEYSLVPQGKAKKIDTVSIRYLSKRPESRDSIYMPHHTKNYNLIENQWIKHILHYIFHEMNTINQYLEKHKGKVKSEMGFNRSFSKRRNTQVELATKVLNELEDFEVFIRRARNECIQILQVDWLNEVENKRPIAIPHALNMDMRYRQVYQLYHLLKNDELSISLDNQYDYYWKRTDLLYEIWGFLKLIKGLQHESVGFDIKGGWIYDMSLQNQSIQIPFLEKGTVVEFTKGSILLRLVYDEPIPYKDNSSLYSPLYAAGSHNRPDARLDLYDKDKEEYIGSIVVDFKYRALGAIWDDRKLNSHYLWTDVMKQLTTYKKALSSKYIYKKKSPGLWKILTPVQEVWAIYPKHEGNVHKYISATDDYQTRLIELTPLEDNETFYQQLNQSIQNVIKMYNHEDNDE
ncbi:DUF2357 domain-containing protein [Peribacillus asahii]|uniref:DUF2357 domain-containing protein n=1 Tax=Peribacillus asahii TaxID=228899 RepID=UPI002079B705|nr:DUF2357 domain-containing protein [Peribacillus asahii]USK71150.1 DUF2357 domain-containing protein [Peribacillus asahii]